MDLNCDKWLMARSPPPGLVGLQSALRALTQHRVEDVKCQRDLFTETTWRRLATASGINQRQSTKDFQSTETRWLGLVAVAVLARVTGGRE